MSGPSQIQRVVTSGKFELDGGSWDVDNNIWLVGDDSDVIVFDAAHSAAGPADSAGATGAAAARGSHHQDRSPLVGLAWGV